MFARVITAKAGAEGFDEVVRLAQHEISGAQQRPEFAGFHPSSKLATLATRAGLLVFRAMQQRESACRPSASSIAVTSRGGGEPSAIKGYQRGSVRWRLVRSQDHDCA